MVISLKYTIIICYHTTTHQHTKAKLWLKCEEQAEINLETNQKTKPKSFRCYYSKICVWGLKCSISLAFEFGLPKIIQRHWGCGEVKLQKMQFVVIREWRSTKGNGTLSLTHSSAALSSQSCQHITITLHYSLAICHSSSRHTNTGTRTYIHTHAPHSQSTAECPGAKKLK